MRPLVRHWSYQLLASLPKLLPCTCALCGSDNSGVVCDECRLQFLSQARRRCARCAIPLETADAVCGDCLTQTPAFDATIVGVDYAPPVDQLILALKFGSRLQLAPLFAQVLRNAMLDAEGQSLPTRLVPVPLGRKRLAERGFNQALEIARPLSRALGAALDTRLVARQRETFAQAMLPLRERYRNMRGAFIVPDEAAERVRGAHIGVVDDVMTTGQTLNEIAALLKGLGAVRVTNLVFARTGQR